MSTEYERRQEEERRRRQEQERRIREEELRRINEQAERQKSQNDGKNYGRPVDERPGKDD